MQSAHLFFCVDQGRSKTHVLLADNFGKIYGSSVQPGACHALDGMSTAIDPITAGAKEILHNTEITLVDIEAVYAGLTGADWPHEYTLLANEIQKVLGISDVHIYNDCLIAMRGGTEVPYGAVICAGSGMNVAVRNKEQQEFVYGYYIAAQDQGGLGLGNSAFEAVCLAHSGVAIPTGLTEALQHFFDQADTDSLVRYVYDENVRSKHIKDVAPLVFSEAEKGDVAALTILGEFGHRAGCYVAAAAERLNMQHSSFDVVLSGSIFKSTNETLLNSLVDSIRMVCPLAQFREAKFEPIAGAFFLALDSFYPNGIPEKVHNVATLEMKREKLLRTTSDALINSLQIRSSNEHQQNVV